MSELFWKFDVKSGRYRYTDTGQFAPREAIMNLINGRVAIAKQEIGNITDNFTDGRISLKAWEKQIAEQLKFIHVQSAILGKGGIDKMQPEDWLKVARELKKQYYTGIDESTGKKFGLKQLVKEIKEGKVSSQQLKARLNLYANSGKLSYYEAISSQKKEQNYTLMKRVLGAVHKSCDECMSYASQGWQPIGLLPLPTQKCTCKNNCKCSVLYK